MAQALLLRKYLKLLHIALLVFFFRPFSPGTAQSVLLPGDVAIVSLQADNHMVSFVPLIDLEPGTELYLSNGTWDDSTAELQGNEIKLEVQDAIEAGTLIHSRSTDERLFWQDSLRFSGDTHRVFIYQKENDVHRFITAAGWGEKESWNSEEVSSASDIPQSLTDMRNALLRLGRASNYQYYIRNGASGTAKLLRNFIYDEANWRGQDKPFSIFRTSFNLLPPPVVLFEQSHTSVSESDSAAVLNVAIYEHDGSRLSVDVIFDTLRSTASQEDLQGMALKQTVNFTGLIGDGIYEVQVPIRTDEVYEGKETAIFRLDNLTKGNFGDFLTHSLIINEQRLPDVELLQDHQGGDGVLAIRNNENVAVNLVGWLLKTGNKTHSFDDEAVVDADSLMYWEGSGNTRMNSIIPQKGGLIQLMSPGGKVVSSVKVKPSRILDSTNRAKQEPLAVKSIRDSNSNANSAGNELVAHVSYGNLSSQKNDSGWFVAPYADVGSNEFIPEKMYTWNAESGSMYEIPADQFGELTANEPVFFRLDEAGREIMAKQVSNKETTRSARAELNVELKAVDRNENERIDRSEGMNLIYNNSTAQINVSDLITYVQQNYPELPMAETLYGIFQNSRGQWVYKALSEDEVIAPNMAFWVEIEQPMEPAEFVFSLDSEALQPNNISEQETTTGEESLQLILFQEDDSLSQTVDIHFFDEIASTDRKNLNFYDPLLLPGHQPLKAAIQRGEEFVEETSVSASAEQVVRLPVWVQGEVDSEYSLRVAGHQNLPEDWTVQIEDIENGRSRNFSDDTEKFSFLIKEPAAITTTKSKKDTVTNNTAQHTFNLVLRPPGAQNEQEIEEEINQPRQVELHQNYPNPFNPVTTISFYLPKPERVRLSVFNIVGQPIAVLAEGTLSAGEKHFEWDATDKPSGMYIYQLEVGNKVMTRKMTLVK